MARPYYLLDSNVISEMLNRFPNVSVCSRIEKYRDVAAISSVTWFELLAGVQGMPEGKRRNYLLDAIVNTVQVMFPIIDYDQHAAWIHADIMARTNVVGKPRPYQDSQIAATAVANNMILVTRNIKDFADIQEVSPLMVESWWE